MTDSPPLTAEEIANLRTFVGKSFPEDPSGPIAWVPWETWQRILATLGRVVPYVGAETEVAGGIMLTGPLAATPECRACGSDDHRTRDHHLAATPVAEGLDVERLAMALTTLTHAHCCWDVELDAPVIAAEYARLFRPATEETR